MHSQCGFIVWWGFNLDSSLLPNLSGSARSLSHRFLNNQKAPFWDLLKKPAFAKAQAGRPFVGFALTSLVLFAPFALTYSVYALGAKAPAALPVERHVLACTGWAGETAGLFEQASCL